MFKLLNRISWLISLSMGYLIAFSLIGLDTYRGIAEEEIFFSIIWGVIVGIIFKRIVLSQNFIEERVRFFAEALNKNPNPSPEIFEKKQIKYESMLGDLNTNNYEEKEENVETSIHRVGLNNQEETKYDWSNEEQEKDKYMQKSDDWVEKNVETSIHRVGLNNQEQIKSEPREPSEFELLLARVGNGIKDFFATNTIFKLGGILLFLAVIFFLQGVIGNIWEAIGEVGRLILGFIVGFVVFGIGFKIHSKYENEGVIMMGIGILINYAVILAGRYIVGDGGYLSEWTTFLFLILNTIFAVVTSLVFNSKTLLTFSFIFAYAIPFIIDAETNTTPYLLLGYSMIVSLGGIYLGKTRSDNLLKYIALLFGNILFFIAPNVGFVEIEWVAKIFSTVIIGVFATCAFSTDKCNKNLTDKSKTVGLGIPTVIIVSYLFIIFHLFSGGEIISSGIGFVAYMFSILLFFCISIYLFLMKYLVNIVYVLIFPILIILGITFGGMINGELVFFAQSISIILLFYLVGFVFLSKYLSKLETYIFFGILLVFVFFMNGIYGLSGSFNIYSLGLTSFITVIMSSFIYLFLSYYYSSKKGFESLFLVGTIGTIFTLAPVLVFQSDNSSYVNISIFAIILFAISNWITPFINKNLIAEVKENGNFISLITGSIFASLFIAFQIYNYFSGVATGIAFIVLAIIYFIQGFVLFSKVGEIQKEKTNNLKDVVYSYLGISLSLFSIAIAFVFSKNPEIVSAVWLFEATLLFGFFNRKKDIKIMFVAILLLIVGTLELVSLDVNYKEYYFLVSFSLIFISIIYNLKLIDFVNISDKLSKSLNVTHDIIHLIIISILGGFLYTIIGPTGHGWSLLGISIFLTLIGYFYSIFNSKFLKYVFVFILLIFSFGHIGEINSIFYRVDKDDMNYLKILQYIVTLLIISSAFIWNKFNKLKLINIATIGIVGVYSFIISNLYILDIFENIFGDITLTIYWGLIASALLVYGIQKDVIKYRTIGLYFLILTTLKIFGMDVWEINDTNSRVFALGSLGVIYMIIGWLYTKKYGDSLKEELYFSNIVPETKSKSRDVDLSRLNNEEETKTLNHESVTGNEDNIINIKIQEVDISGIEKVKFKVNEGRRFSSKKESLIRISKLICDGKEKTSFEAGELKESFAYVKKNYKSDLVKADYDKVVIILKEFVDNGGEVTFE